MSSLRPGAFNHWTVPIPRYAKRRSLTPKKRPAVPNGRQAFGFLVCDNHADEYVVRFKIRI